MHNLDDLDSRHQSLYSDEARDYDRNRFSFKRGRLYHHLELHVVLAMLSPIAGKSILDVATGTGRIAHGMQQAGAIVHGADLTLRMLETAAAKNLATSSRAVSWTNANGRFLPFRDDSFDVVASFRFLHLLPPAAWDSFLDEMHRVLKPNGILLLELFNPFYGGPLSLARQLRNRLRGIAGEQYVWPWAISRKLKRFSVERLVPFWLPGMGLLGSEQSQAFLRAGELCAAIPLKWIAGPFIVQARKV